METFWQDLRFGLRQLVTDKAFSVAAILTLALGIGATATIFTVVDAVLLKQLPYRNPGNLVILQGNFKEKGKPEASTWPISQMDFDDWKKRNTAFTGMSVWGQLPFNLEHGLQSQRIEGELVNANYFSLLGVEPARGRFFTPDEDARPMEQFVVVLGYDFWRQAFGGDPTIVGRKIQLNGRFYQVVGIGPKGFRGLSDSAELWVPSMLPPIPGYLQSRSMRWATGVARLNPGVTLGQAQERLSSITTALEREVPDTNEGLGATVKPLREFWFGKLRGGLLAVTVGACILLLIACINVASLLLARAVAKQRAWSIRIAIGASRLRLARQMLTESLLLSLIGAAAGLLLARWAAPALIAVSGTEFPSFVKLSLDARMVAATIGLALLCGLIFGLAPMFTSFRANLTQSLGRDEKREEAGKGWHRFHNGVVIAQVALALMLSIAAVLMAKSFYRMVGEDLGFRPKNLLTFRVDLKGPKYTDDNVAIALLRREYLPRISGVPGVRKLAMATPTLPTDNWAGTYITIEDHASNSVDGTYPAINHAVTPAYFDVLGVPILKGRLFNDRDTDTNAVIVSKQMADEQWPGQDPIGKRLKIGARGIARSPWLTVVGVAAPMRHEGFQDEKPPAGDIYLSLLQFIRRPLTVNFLARAQPGVPVDRLRPALHREFMAINPEVPDYDVTTMAERLDKQTSKARFQVVLISLFTVLALILASIGIYGVISYSVTQRTREIAIRMSLGADRRRILRMVVGRGAVLAALGLVLGLVAIFSASRFLVGLLYQTSVVDPLILGGTSLALFLVTLAANYLPARRAAVQDPMVTLRLQ